MNRRALRAQRGVVAIALLAAAWGLGSCSTKKTILPDVPPETGVFVQGQLDTVNHVVELFWFGNDPDGDVVGFEVRFVNLPPPATDDWVFTTRTDSVFTVFTPTGYSAPRFEVRAIDNSQQRDPTPAVADFSFSNLPPVVTITGAPGARDSVYATATVDWSVADPDGNPNAVQYRVWLDGNEAGARIVSGRTFSIPPADFIDGPGVRAGNRYLVVQPIDDGGLVGTADTAQFFVRDAQGARMLVIDDLASDIAQNYQTDLLFYDAATRALPGPGGWSLLQLQFNRPFRTVTDLEQTLSQFDVVVWYRGNRDPLATQPGSANPLRDLQDGLVTYVESGGRLLLEGNALFRYTDAQNREVGLLRHEMGPLLFGGDLVKRFETGRDSLVNFGIKNGGNVRTSIWSDSLRFQAIVEGVFSFHYGDTNQVAFWAPPLQLTSNNPERLAIGKSVPHANGGRAVVMAFPIRIGNAGASPPPVPRILDRVFADLLGP